MAYEIHLPTKVYSRIIGASAVNTVESLEVVNGCIHVGNWFVPISNIICIKEV